MNYEYQVLESDSPTVPPEMLNEQGKEGWMLCGTTIRNTKNPEGERWVFYFIRLCEQKPCVSIDT